MTRIHSRLDIVLPEALTPDFSKEEARALAMTPHHVQGSQVEIREEL